LHSHFSDKLTKEYTTYDSREFKIHPAGQHKIQLHGLPATTKTNGIGKFRFHIHDSMFTSTSIITTAFHRQRTDCLANEYTSPKT